MSGLPTGFRDLDSKLAGLQPSNLIVFAARPSMGKSSLALNIATNVAKNTEEDTKEKVVAVFSLEMMTAGRKCRMIDKGKMMMTLSISTAE